jgi:L-aminopeptidase/D-esterase-like protein
MGSPAAIPAAHAATPSGKPRARALGIPYAGRPGQWNSITDVPGTEVGYVTLISGDSVRTGVTGIHPRGRQGAADPVAAGVFCQNGNGEMTGIPWITESGNFSGPVAITNTHAVGIAHAGIVAWTVRHHPESSRAWLLPVATETSDGYLSDLNGHHVSEEHVVQALETATSGHIEEGSVGGGTGMNSFQFKSGSGTASRRVLFAGTNYTVGAFVQANFGSRTELTLAGVPVGLLVDADNPMAEDLMIQDGAGSAVVIIATDAPLLPQQCTALARRATLGLARTGTVGSHFSGDLFLAYSTANSGGITPTANALRTSTTEHFDQLTFVPWGYMDPFYAAVVQSTEEAVANSLVANSDMTGLNGHFSVALPHDQVAALFADQEV